MPDSFYIVTIGASSGGLEELNSFFDYTIALDVSYVIVHHFSMENTSRLVELISRHSKLPIVVAEDQMKLKINTVYLLPIDSMITIQKYCFHFKPPVADGLSELKIDLLLRSVAICCGSKAIGVLLSGMGVDGVDSLKEIKKMGGMIIVRNPKTTTFNITPKNAIESGLVDYILEPELMPAAIATIINR